MSSEESLDIALEPGRSSVVPVQGSALLGAANENKISHEPTKTTSSSLEIDRRRGKQEVMCSTVGDVTVKWTGPDENNSCSISSQSTEDRNTGMATCHDLEVQLNVNGNKYLANDDSQRSHDLKVVEPEESQAGTSSSISHLSDFNLPATEAESDSPEVEEVSSQSSNEEGPSMGQPDADKTYCISGSNDGVHDRKNNQRNGHDSTEMAEQQRSNYDCQNNSQDSKDKHFDIGELVSNIQRQAINFLFHRNKSELTKDELEENSDCTEDKGASHCDANQCSKELSEDSTRPKSVAEQQSSGGFDSNRYDETKKEINTDKVECIEEEVNSSIVSSIVEEIPLLNQNDVLDREDGGDSLEEIEVSRIPADEIENKASSTREIKSKDNSFNPDCESSLPNVIDTDDENSDTSNDSNEKRNTDLGDDSLKTSSVFDCGEMFPIHGNEADEIDKYEVQEGGDTIPNIENVHSFHVDQIPRSVDEIDGLNPSSSEEEDLQGSGIEEEEGEENVESSGRRVSFKKDLISSVHELERVNPEDKVNMFYTSKDLTGFRIDYILEIQEIHEQMERQRVGGSTLLRTLAAKFNEIVSCKPLIDFFCANPNRASI